MWFVASSPYRFNKVSQRDQGPGECDAEEGCAPLIDTNGELEVAATFVSLPVLKRKR